MRLQLPTLALLFTLSTPALAGMAVPPLQTAAHVDLARYMGSWYEIAAIPQPFEQGCVGSQATYTLQSDKTVRVVNSCHRGSSVAPLDRVAGTASVTDEATNAKLAVTFDLAAGATQGAYWILAVDDGYQHALVGTPDRQSLWILDRSAHPSAAVVARLVYQAAEQGFDVSKLMLSPQP